MWHPFRRVTLPAVVPAKTINPAVGPEATDPVYRSAKDQAQLRSLLARSQITMIHEQLAANALAHMRGGKQCPE